MNINETFSDQFFASTEGHNDLRRKRIQDLLQAQTSSYRAAIEKMPTRSVGGLDFKVKVLTLFTEGKE